MKRIITLSLLLCTNSNVILAANTSTETSHHNTNAATKTIPISYETTINKLQTSIAYLEAHRASLAWVDRAKVPWTCVSVALLAIACAPINMSPYFSDTYQMFIRLFGGIMGFYTQLYLIKCIISKASDDQEIPVLQQQIDRLIAKSQQECNHTEGTSI